MRKTTLYLISFFLLIPAILFSQDEAPTQKATSLSMIYASYAYQWPGGDLLSRFGPSSTIGPGFLHKTSSNWLFGADINFIFGSTIREDSLIQNLVNTDGFVINDQGHYGEISFFERGFNTSFRFGKIIPVFGSNPNSGILILAGVGYMQHKIKIEVENKAVSPLKGDYLKGYDRFSDGLSATQFIGYMHIGSTRLANFYAGFEFTQAWTKNRRSMDFDTERRDDKDRLDLLSGIKVGWIMPFNKREPDEFYYY